MKSNKFIIGIGIGVVPIFIAYLLTHHTNWVEYIGGKPLSWYVLAAFANILFIRQSYKAGLDHRAKGLAFITFAGMLALLIFKQIQLF